MDKTNDDYHYDFEIEGSTSFESPASVNPNSTPFLGVHIKSYVNRYDWGIDHHSIPSVEHLEHFKPCRIDNRSTAFGHPDLRNSSWKRSYSRSMAFVNPHITRGTKVHGDILSEISRIIDEVNNADRCTKLTHLRLDITVTEHVLNECVCNTCKAIEESERRAIVPASEASIKKLESVEVVAAADLEAKKRENGGRKRRETSKKECAKRPSVGDECSICTNRFRSGKYVAQMPCMHSFHKPCIEGWLRRSNKCPICRRKIPAARRRTGRAKNA